MTVSYVIEKARLKLVERHCVLHSHHPRERNRRWKNINVRISEIKMDRWRHRSISASRARVTVTLHHLHAGMQSTTSDISRYNSACTQHSVWGHRGCSCCCTASTAKTSLHIDLFISKSATEATNYIKKNSWALLRSIGLKWTLPISVVRTVCHVGY